MQIISAYLWNTSKPLDQTTPLKLKATTYVLANIWKSSGTPVSPRQPVPTPVAAVQHYLPQLRKKLPRSWKLKAIWDKLELPCQAVPLRLDSLLGIMGYFWKKGYPEMACGCAIAFNGLLRTGELLQLLVSDCTFTDNQCVLTLRNTKSGQRRLLQDESVVITDPLTLTLLVKLTKRKQPGHSLLPLSPAKFRTLWNHMRTHLSLTCLSPKTGLFLTASEEEAPHGILKPQAPSAKPCSVVVGNT